MILLVTLSAACAPRGDLGARVWARKCSGCHGDDGKGRTKFAKGRPHADLTDGVWKHGGDLPSVTRLITEGDPASPMPPYEGRLTSEEIAAVAGHVLKLAAPPSHATPATPVTPVAPPAEPR